MAGVMSPHKNTQNNPHAHTKLALSMLLARARLMPVRAAAGGMRWLAAVPVVMPRVADSVTSGSIASVLKKAGEAVKEDDLLFEVETDKVRARRAKAERSCDGLRGCREGRLGSEVGCHGELEGACR
jgi:multidrug resistance efflux pump